MIFKEGDKVRFSYDTTIGEVLQVRDEGGKYLIKWENARCDPDWEIGDHLILVNDATDKKLANKLQSKIDKVTSLLEKAFEIWGEARHNDSFRYLEDRGLIDISKFGNAAGEFGWTSSSLYCS